MGASIKDYVNHRANFNLKTVLGTLDEIVKIYNLTPDDAYLFRKRILDSHNEMLRTLESVLRPIDAEIVLKVKGHEKQDNIFIQRNN